MNDNLGSTASVTAELLLNTLLGKNLTFNSNGTFVYRPKPNFLGTVLMFYQLRDAQGAVSAPARVEILVSSSCTTMPPVAVADNATTTAGQPVTINVLANDPDGDRLTVKKATQPRTNEIGIRMALGADKGAVLNLVLRSAFTRVAIGLGLGVPLAIGAGKLLAAQLYGVKFWDPVALAVATGSLTLCAVVAALIPASRAASIPPMHALRLE